MEIKELLNKLHDLADEWESYECNISDETDERCTATEEAMWGCAERLNDLIAEVEEEIEEDI